MEGATRQRPLCLHFSYVPAAVGAVTVRFADTARAEAETPQRPAKSNVRVAPATSAGPA
jgi:hypothetical protein